MEKKLTALSKARLRPSQLIRISAALSRLVNSLLVNCTRLYGVEDFRPSPTHGSIQPVQAEARIHRHGDFPGQDIPTVPINDRHQIDEPPLEADIGDITGPHLVASFNAHASQQVRVLLHSRPWQTGLWLWGDRLQNGLPYT